MTGGFSVATLRNAAGNRDQFKDGQSMNGGVSISTLRDGTGKRRRQMTAGGRSAIPPRRALRRPEMRAFLLAIVGLGSIAVVILDAAGSYASNKFGFRFTKLALGSFCIYGCVGALAAHDGSVGIGAAAGGLVAMVDATIGWAISWYIGPGPYFSRVSAKNNGNRAARYWLWRAVRWHCGGPCSDVLRARSVALAEGNGEVSETKEQRIARGAWGHQRPRARPYVAWGLLTLGDERDVLDVRLAERVHGAHDRRYFASLSAFM